MWPSITVHSKAYLVSFLSALFISLCLTPVICRLALTFNLVAAVREDRWHTKPTALFGGVAIFVSVLAVWFFIPGLFLPFRGFLVSAVVIFIWGLLDDILNLKPYVKLLGQVIAACIALYFHRDALYLWNSVLSLPIVILWIIGITNSFNMLDNMDGLACGIAGIAFFFLSVSSLLDSNYTFAIVTAILSGASLGFLPYNFNPARIFMGDGGSMFLGFSLAVMTVMCTTTGKQIPNVLVTVAVPILTMAVPIFDTAFVSFARLMRGQSIIKGGRDHSSHRLVYFGFSVRKTVLLFYAVSALLGGIALSFSRFNGFVMSVLAVLSAIVLIYFGFFLAEVKVKSDEGMARKAKSSGGKAITVFSGALMYKRRIMEVLIDLVLICVSYYTAFFLRLEGYGVFESSLYLISESLPLLILIKMSAFFICGMYRGVWKYTSLYDLINIFKAVSLGSILSVITVTFLFRFRDYSRAVFFIDWLLLMLLVSGARIVFRLIGEFLGQAVHRDINVVIYGAGDTGELVLREIKRNKSLNYNAVCFVDDDPKKTGSKIHGVKICGGRGDLSGIIKAKSVQEVIVAIPSANPLLFAEISDICRSCGVRCHHINGILGEVNVVRF